MTVHLPNIKKLFVGDKELKKLYKGDQLIWQGNYAWRKQLDLYPRGVWCDDDGNVYVIVLPEAVPGGNSGAKGTFRIQKYSSDGELTLEIAGLGERNYDFSLYIENGLIYTSLKLKTFDANTGEIVFEPGNTQFNATDGLLNKHIYFVSYSAGMIIVSNSLGIKIGEYKLPKTDDIPIQVCDMKVRNNKIFILTTNNFVRIYESTNDTTYTLSKELGTSVNMSGIAFDIDSDENYYILLNNKLVKYNVSFEMQWEIILNPQPALNSGSLMLIDDYVVYITQSLFAVVDKNTGEEQYRKIVTNSWAGSTTVQAHNLISKDCLSDEMFFYVDFDNKALFKLEIGDEDTYEHLN